MTAKEIEAARLRIRHEVHSGLKSPYAEEVLADLDALCAEVERLKAEAKVMKSACDSVDIYWNSDPVDKYGFHAAYKDAKAAMAAYRTMKGGSDAHPD